MNKAAEQLRVNLGKMADDMKKLREESEASEQVTDSCEDSVEMLQGDIKLGIEEPNELQSLVDFSKGMVEMPSESSETGPSRCKSLAKEHFSVGLSMQMKTNFGQIQNKLQGYHWETGDSRQEVDKDPKSPQIRYKFSNPTSIDFLQEPLKVNSNPVEVVDCDAPEKMVVCVAELIDPHGIRMVDLKGNSFEFLATSTAQQVFDKMPMRNSNDRDFSIHLNNVPLLTGNWVFDPRDFTGLGIAKQMSFESEEILMMESEACRAFSCETDCNMDVKCKGRSRALNSCLSCKGFSWEVQDNVLVFDPGILELAGCDIMIAVNLKSTDEFKAGINTSIYFESANWKPAAAIDYVESLPFDPGGLVLWSFVNFDLFVKVVITIELCKRGNKSFDVSLKVKRLVFDPGGSGYLLQVLLVAVRIIGTDVCCLSALDTNDFELGTLESG